ncbi:serine protease nudel [Anopheles darlingi]|uniref:Serine protease nudel n=1 Tax=Anopheles darlingi TaxID=43151 RepID=W5JNR1_ANODA|nr:serine protease nudel [Anopheles darlingi]
MVHLNQIAHDANYPIPTLRMQQLIGEKRSNLCFMLLSAVAALFVMAALAYACYLTALCTGLLEQSSAPVLPLASLVPVEQSETDEDVVVLQQSFFQTEGYEVLKRSLDLLEYMEQLEPVLEEHRSRQRRDAANPDTPNRIERTQSSNEIMYGVRRRTQREQDLGTLPIIYDNTPRYGVNGGVPRRKRHSPLELNLDDLERAKRNAQQDYKRLEREYYRCRKSAPNAKICDQIHEKLVRLSEEVNARFQEMANLLQGMQEPVEKGTTEQYAYPIYSSTAVRSSTPVSSTGRWLSSTPRTTTRPRGELVSSGHIVEYDPSQHIPNVNSSIRSLDDLYDHINLQQSISSSRTTNGDVVSSTAAPPLTATESTTTTSTTTTTTTDTIVRNTNPTKASPHRWIVTKNPKQAARNLHDVVNQLQLAQMLQPHPIHEDMVMMPQAPPASIDELVMARARNRDHTHHDRQKELDGAVAADLLLDTTIPTSPDSLTAVDGDVVTGPDSLRSSHTPLQQQQHQHQSPLSVGPSAPFLSLCDQLRSAGGSSIAGKPGQLSPHTGFQHAGPGFPITGEATKATSQIIVNSGFGAPGYIPNTVCFYQNGPPPATGVPYPFQRPASGGTSYAPSYSAGYPQVYQQHHQQQQQPQHHHHPGGAGGKLPLNDPSIEALIQPRLSEATIHMPVSIHNLQHGVGGRTPEDVTNNVLVCSMVQQHQQLQHGAAAAAPAQQRKRSDITTNITAMVPLKSLPMKVLN